MVCIVSDKTAERSTDARLVMFSPLSRGGGLSVTYDSGPEFARHARLRDELGVATYFADPYSKSAAGWRREQKRHYPPLPVQMPQDRHGHGQGRAKDYRRDRQPAYACARLPHPGRGIHRRTDRLTESATVLRFIYNEPGAGCWVLWHGWW